MFISFPFIINPTRPIINAGTINVATYRYAYFFSKLQETRKQSKVRIAIKFPNALPLLIPS